MSNNTLSRVMKVLSLLNPFRFKDIANEESIIVFSETQIGKFTIIKLFI